MSSGERPIGTAKGKQSDTEALYQHPPPPPASTPPPPPACPRTLTAGRHMVIEVPPLTDRERTPNDEYVGIWDPHGNPAGGPPLPNK